MAKKASFHKQNRLRQLRAFCRAAQSGSISKAADRLKLSQPSVSLQIQSLEKELDVLLFERRGPRIQLTPAGATLLELALPLVEGMDTLPDLFAAQLGQVHAGVLDIASGESTLLYLLPEAIKRFKQRYPQINVRLHNVTGRDGMAMLRADEVDFAVGSMLEVPDDLSYHPLQDYDPILITPLDHPLAGRDKITLQDISPYGLILPPRHLATWRVVDLVFQQHEVSYNVCLEAGGWEVIKRYVQIGLGVSIVTSICLRDEEPLWRCSLAEYFPKRSYGVVLRRGRFLSPQAQRFLELLDEDGFEHEPSNGKPAAQAEHPPSGDPA